MPRVAITGGIGSGKTAVTDYLAERGAVVVDADVIARDVVVPDKPAWRQLRDAFGDAVLQADGTLDREFVAQIVFHDAAALRRLNAITHTAIGTQIATELADVAATRLAVVALPLFRPAHRELFGLHEVWCVVADPATVLERLVTRRGMTPADAEARVAAQISNDERQRTADEIIVNNGKLDDLRARVDELLRRKGYGD